MGKDWNVSSLTSALNFGSNPLQARHHGANTLTMSSLSGLASSSALHSTEGGREMSALTTSGAFMIIDWFPLGANLLVLLFIKNMIDTVGAQFGKG